MARAALASKPIKAPADAAAVEEQIKLTVRLPEGLHRRLKASCAMTGESLQDRIERLVTADLDHEKAGQRGKNAV